MILLCIVSYNIRGQTYYYNAYQFAYKYKSYGRWANWSNWENCNILVTIDYTNDLVRIYSNSPQTYKITRYIRKYIDNSGGQQAEFSFIDQDYDRGNMRLRIESNGNSQIYIDFADMMWVYNVTLRRY